MDVKRAIELAKGYIQEIFREDDISEGAREEVEFDDATSYWRITIGFSRPWEQRQGLIARGLHSRTYKTVGIDDGTGKVRSVKNREIAA